MFNNNDSSYIKMESDKIIDKCDLVISHIEQKQQQQNRQSVAGEIKKYRKKIKYFSFLKRFLPSTKEVRQELKNKDNWYKWGIYPSRYNWFILKTAKQCRGLAKRSQDGLVFLSRKDFSDIFAEEVK
jgi:hypothetical protein